MKAYALQDTGLDTVDANRQLGFEDDLRDYKASADMLKELGIKKIKLITNNPVKIEGLVKYGIEVSKRVPIEVNANKYDIGYLKTKKTRMNHLLNV